MGFDGHLGYHQYGRGFLGWGVGSQEFSSQEPALAVPDASASLLMCRESWPDMATGSDWHLGASLFQL